MPTLFDHGILMMGITEARERYEVERIGVSWHVAAIGLEGEGEVFDEAGSRPLRPGQLAVLPALGRAGLRLVGACWRFAWLLPYDRPRWAGLHGALPTIAPAVGAESLYHAIALACGEAALAEQGQATAAIGLAVTLFERALGQPRPADATAQRLAALFGRVEAAPAEDWRTEQLAALHGVSPTHFHRLCRQHLGRSPRTLLLEARMARAQALILAGQDSVTELALAVGYREIASFSRRFAQHFGTPPSAAIRQAREPAAAAIPAHQSGSEHHHGASLHATAAAMPGKPLI
ncbi:helix-turn-helix transcriptional regulator [Chitinimonas koreensis]|uniref:helix-turn-helix transcriptional regulator n=1 Tax=Chitinimonas koreensis TaxID=356302 RepID=UPI001654A4E7|nr:AraC family transcriptional regulator [Chitinimonas koreensis]QNM95748.1 helix-turn-helix transcriptional regulator [Chitinimonas koreensis]